MQKSLYREGKRLWGIEMFANILYAFIPEYIFHFIYYLR